MTDLNEEFRQTYEAIKSAINRIAGREGSNDFELSEAVRLSNRVRNRLSDLKYIRDVRNVQNHPQQRNGQPTFVITEAFITWCIKVHDQLAQSATAGQLGIERAKLCIARWETCIHPLVQQMRKERFSHIPIVDDADRIVGVFNEASILDYLMASDMMSLIEPEQTLEDIRPHCAIGADHVETFRFISPLASEDKVADIFLSVTGPFTRVGAVFVTPGAAPEQPIQRMITAWDVLSQSREAD